MVTSGTISGCFEEVLEHSKEGVESWTHKRGYSLVIEDIRVVLGKLAGFDVGIESV
jgi:hypothetical protein